MIHKQLKHLRLANFIVIMTLFAFITSFSFVVKEAFTEINKKDLQISSLINEMGELKERSDVNFTTWKLEAGDLKKYIALNEKNIKALSDKNIDINVLNLERQELMKSLSAKEIQVNQLISESSRQKKITEKKSNLINLLVLGINNKLTDSILVISINTEKQEINFISVPRDMYYNGRKLNELYKKYGIKELKNAIADISGLSISKYAIWNFDSFKMLIDELGGVEINVEKALHDDHYPDEGNGYQTVDFKKGIQTMDGDSALKYARSRKSTSDFDRSKRQQQIFTAAMKKIKSMDLVSKIDVTLKIYSKLKPQIITDIDLFEALSYYSNYSNYKFNNNLVLSSSNYLFSSQTASGQFILLPRISDYSEINGYVSRYFL